eukprot:TRINITY_DN2324_c0_g1_i23.p1 TRINITY_DN2324_c0_g1~~TRINITY_DN2324_c0_g1_i23.p1  ORF type:complete len:485 (-),score=106.85 TRINITY_DN2324_c0_g1_i23:256-1710(-)
MRGSRVVVLAKVKITHGDHKPEDAVGDANFFVIQLSRRQVSRKESEDATHVNLQGVVFFLVTDTAAGPNKDYLTHRTYEKIEEVNIMNREQFMEKDTAKHNNPCGLNMDDEGGVELKLVYDYDKKTVQLYTTAAHSGEFELCKQVDIAEAEILLGKKTYLSFHGLTGKKSSVKIDMLGLDVYSNHVPKKKKAENGEGEAVEGVKAKDSALGGFSIFGDGDGGFFEFGDIILQSLKDLHEQEALDQQSEEEKKKSTEMKQYYNKILREHNNLETSLDVLTIHSRESHEFLMSLEKRLKYSAISTRDEYDQLLVQVLEMKQDLLSIDEMARNISEIYFQITRYFLIIKELSSYPDYYLRLSNEVDRVVNKLQETDVDELISLTRKFRELKFGVDQHEERHSQLQEDITDKLIGKKADNLQQNVGSDKRMFVIISLMVLVFVLAFVAFKKLRRASKSHLLQHFHSLISLYLSLFTVSLFLYAFYIYF